MSFRKFLTILAILFLTVLMVQPVLSAGDITSVVTNHTAENVTRTVTNLTSDLEQDNATNFYNNAERVLVNGNFDNAIVLFDQALASNITILKKTDALLYVYRDKAYAQIQLGKYNDAIATVDAGLAVYPGDALLWNNKGKALEKLGKNQDALTAYDNAVYLNQNYTLAHVNRGILLSQMGRYSEAVAAYSLANETNPFDEDILNGLEAAKKGESQSNLTMTIVLTVVLIAVIGIVVWYVKFRKPAEPEPEKKRTKSQKK